MPPDVGPSCFNQVFKTNFCPVWLILKFVDLCFARVQFAFSSTFSLLLCIKLNIFPSSLLTAD
jgi:hypothetical protein